MEMKESWKGKELQEANKKKIKGKGGELGRK